MLVESKLKNTSRLFSQLSEHYADSTLADFVECDARYIRALKTNLTRIPVTEAIRIFKALGISYSTVTAGKADIGCIISKINGQKFIHPRYQTGCFSKSINAADLLSVADGIVGTEFGDDILAELQVSRELLEGEVFDVSAELACDIIDQIIKNNTHVTAGIVGGIMFYRTMGGKFKELFRNLSPKKAYAIYLEEVLKKLEKSHDYRVHSLTSSGAILRKYGVEKLQEIHGKKVYWRESTTSYQVGFSAAVASVGTNGRPANIKRISTANEKFQHYCEIELDFSA